MTSTTRGKAAGWMLFLGCFLLLSFAATSRYSKTADLALISLRLTLLLVLSVLFVREQLRYYRNRETTRVNANLDRSGTVLQRLRRWFYDEPEQRD